MDVLLEQIAEHIVIAILGGLGLAAMVLHTVTAILTNASRERSRREIAAYVAEGSMSPEQGERLMAADATRA